MEVKFVPSVCSYCGTGCGVLFQVVDGDLVRTLPLKTHPVNQGKLCIKGWNLHEYITSYMRLKHPLVKASQGSRRPARTRQRGGAGLGQDHQ
jgi:predicted molibdopterin-dependent oxidoreductase YjgC